MPDRTIMLSAGEASGDLHGGTLCRALRALEPTVNLVGMGGPRMAAAGMEGVADSTHHAGVGLKEAVGRGARPLRAPRGPPPPLPAPPPDGSVPLPFPQLH